MTDSGDYRVYLHHNTWPALAPELELEGDMVIERAAGLAFAPPGCICRRSIHVGRRDVRASAST